MSLSCIFFVTVFALAPLNNTKRLFGRGRKLTLQTNTIIFRQQQSRVTTLSALTQFDVLDCHTIIQHENVTLSRVVNNFLMVSCGKLACGALRVFYQVTSLKYKNLSTKKTPLQLLFRAGLLFELFISILLFEEVFYIVYY